MERQPAAADARSGPGAHVDVLAGAAAGGTLLLARRHPLWAGVALAVAVGTKLPYGAVVVGVAAPRPRWVAT